jgi:hypothetical protein
MKMLPELIVAQDFRIVRAQVLPSRNQKPACAAGRVADDGSGCGSVISTISRMMWRGVRNCPFCPAEAILPSIYS